MGRISAAARASRERIPKEAPAKSHGVMPPSRIEGVAKAEAALTRMKISKKASGEIEGQLGFQKPLLARLPEETVYSSESSMSRRSSESSSS